jgi:hypothetical protein
MFVYQDVHLNEVVFVIVVLSREEIDCFLNIYFIKTNRIWIN